MAQKLHKSSYCNDVVLCFVSETEGYKARGAESVLVSQAGAAFKVEIILKDEGTVCTCFLSQSLHLDDCSIIFDNFYVYFVLFLEVEAIICFILNFET